MITRRKFMQSSISMAAMTLFPRITLADNPIPSTDHTLIMQETPVELIKGTTSPAFTFNGHASAPPLRIKQGEKVRIAVVNKLNQATTIHWHGLRIDNAMDGVPYLTQPPIEAGETFIYEFTPPDAGTFWYHTHLNSLEQLSKGLVGALIVEEADPVNFDHEVVLSLKDWLLNDDGSFKEFTSLRNAWRMGTLGNYKAVNGMQKPVFEIPAGASTRLRVLNLDNTRVFHVSFKDQLPEAKVISNDGMPFKEPRDLDAYPLGAGMRMDVGFIAPSELDKELILYDRKGKFHFEICRLKIVKNNKSASKTIPTLKVNPIPEPELKKAKPLKFVFEWEGAVAPAGKDGKKDPVFWTINRRGWTHDGMKDDGSHHHLPEPLATLKKGTSYIIELRNNTPHSHPIHMHGEIMTVLNSNKRDIEPYQADTVLLKAEEVVNVSLKADNVGKWMFHCHVIEHMKTGLMGYIEIV